jgi:hypothetical protein
VPSCATDPIEQINCPNCKEHVITVDPKFRACPYKCTCGFSYTYAALHSKSPNADRFSIQKELAIGAASRLFRSTVAFVKHKTRPRQACSGTAIRIGDRVLLATADHNIPIADVSEKLVIIPVNGSVLPGSDTAIKSAFKSPHKSIDVGILEFTPNDIDEWGYEPITLDDVSDLGTGIDGDSCYITGFPGESFVFDESGEIPTLKLCGLCIPSFSAPSECFPAIKKDIRYGDENTDTLCWYDNSSGIMADKPDGRLPDRPAPYGTSGGGYWQMPNSQSDERIWSPDQLKLYGIQSSWPGEKIFLLGKQIIWWLKLVDQSYSDLQPLIREKFPRIMDLQWPVEKSEELE